MDSFVPVRSFLRLHPQLSPEEKHAGSCAASENKTKQNKNALHIGYEVEEIPKSSFQRGSEAMMIVILIIIFE